MEKKFVELNVILFLMVVSGFVSILSAATKDYFSLNISMAATLVYGVAYVINSTFYLQASTTPIYSPISTSEEEESI